MDLKHLHTFLTLSEVKNFTKTAALLHYAQSNVTTQIQQLEEELGVKLFERIGKGVTLTPEGMELLPYARRMLSLSDNLKLKFSNQDSGRITIGASESICIHRLPEIISVFQRKHPQVELYLHVLDGEEFMPLLAKNSIDAAFLLDAPLSTPSIHTALQFQEEIGVFALPGHPLAQKKLVSIRDFSNIPLIMTGKGCRYRRLFEQELLAAAIAPKIVLETGSIQAMKETALSGLGACLLPRLSVQRELDRGELVKLAYDTGYGFVSQLVYHKDKWISPSLRAFIDTIAATTGR